MQGMVPLYGFGGSGNSGATGATLTVTAPAGCTVKVSKDGKSKTKAANSDGAAVFKGLETGEWTLTITDGDRTRTQSVLITADYSAVIAFFASTIHITYPEGAACTATDGNRTLSAPDTSGVWECVVPNTGTWTITISDGEQSVSKPVEITAEGQIENLSIAFFSATIHVTYPAGSVCTATDGVTTLTAPDTSGTWSCVVENSGLWTVSLDSGFSETVNATTSGETYSLNRWHLINGASDCTAASGGWTAAAKKTESSSGATAANPEITQGTDYIRFSIGAGQSGIVYTNQKIDLTNIDTISVSGELKNSGAFDHSLMMVVWSSIGTYANDNNAATSGVSPGTTASSLNLDVSGLSGSYYIGFKFNTRNASASYASITEFSLIC